MAFTKVKVYPPAHPEQEILLSLTDRNGLFSFTPDEPGEWRLEAADNMGHQGTITLQSNDQAASAPEKKADGKVSLPLRIVLGLSLILNIFAAYSFVLQGLTKKGNKPEVSHAYQ
jgi:nickel transport protein